MDAFSSRPDPQRASTAVARSPSSRLLRQWLIAACLLAAVPAWPHSVGQVQTTKFLAPDTVKLLTDRLAAGQPAGFKSGDTISYIIQFTPVSNGAIVGAGGYITDYLPPGVEVVDASIVAKDASGNFSNIAPALPGTIDGGWGKRGAKTFAAPFNVASYDPTGRCTALALGASCGGRLSEIYADTGIFFSTDPRTAAFPPLPTRIQQSANGYLIAPTAVNQLNPLIGQTVATTHNLWDADQTNAFGSTALPVGTPRSNSAVLSNGTGVTPYYAGSAVAGPQSGYPLDNLAQVGPWQRIAYAGSRIGNPSGGPATSNLANLVVGGGPTSLGYSLSASNPLPPGTNAVRWAVGKLVVGTLSYVRISIRLTQAPPTAGIINSSEVFGGDAGDGDTGQDNAWRYHVPSVADNNSNLFVQKLPCVYDASATVCVPLSGVYAPASSTITYLITYLNSGNSDQTNAVLSDTAPCQTALGASVKIGAVNGPLAAVLSVPYTTTTAVAGNCTSPQTRASLTFPAMPLLLAGSGGRIIINVPNSAGTVDDTVINTARLLTSETSGGVTSNGVTIVGNTTSPYLTLEKTASLASIPAGGTDSYVIVVRNTGTGPATGITISDILPTMGGAAADPTTRFNFNTPTVSISSSLLTTSSALVSSTSTAALGGLSPYSAVAGAANTVQVNWAFGTGTASSLAVGGVITITFNVTAGANMATSATPYVNNVQARYVASQFSGSAGVSDLISAAPVTLTSPLSLTKTLACFYSAGACVAPQPSGDIPVNAKVRYRIDYANTGATSIAAVTLSDTLPCQIASASATLTITAVLSGPITATGTLPYVVAGPFTGNCPATQGTFGFAAQTLAAGQTGALELEVQLTTPPSTSTVAINQARLSSPNAPSAVSQTQNTVRSAANLTLSKIASTSVVYPGNTFSYTITLANNGTAPAQGIAVYDWLPTGTSTTADLTRRFSYNTATSVVSGALTAVAPARNLPPLQTPYSSGAYAANQEELLWTFTGQTLAVDGTASIQITVTAGSGLPVLAPPNYYYNNAKATYATGQSASANPAGVNVSPQANLTISKSNGTTTLVAGSTTSYTVTLSNLGPSPAPGSVVKDTASTGLLCNKVTCASATNSAACPANLPLGSAVSPPATTLFAAGESIPVFPASSTVVLVVGCSVVATGLP
jgi:uncharacterized repeat protein (TIGR01451 family)